MQSNMHQVGIVLLGYGRIGKAAHAALEQVSGQLRQSGIEPQLLAVCEADKHLVAELSQQITGKAIFVDTEAPVPVPISALLRCELGLQSEDEFLVYDATPTHVHQQNLVDICGQFPRALYLGEKPMFTQRAQLSTLERFGSQVLCDFVESQNEATLKLLEMRRSGFRIDRLRFWRLNSTGLAKLFTGQHRVGISGGALLDEGIHDLALALILLRDESATGIIPLVEDAVNLAFMPHATATGNYQISDTSTDRACSRSQVCTNGRVDAAGYAKVSWKTPRRIATEFRYSWIGVERFDGLCAELGQSSLRALLARHGIDKANWLASTPIKAGLSAGFEKQEARVLLIDGSEDGQPVHLVVNFLRRPGIKPFVFHAGKRDYLNLGQHHYCGNSLARVFDIAIRSYVHKQPLLCAPLGAAVIHEAHRTTFDIHDYALDTEAPFPPEAWLGPIQVGSNKLGS